MEQNTADQQVTYFGVLCRRLDTKWHVLRDCRLATPDEQYTVPLVIVHRAFGIGLFALRVEEYTAADMVVRLTRTILREHGLEERFSGFLPIIFLTADPADPRDIRERIVHAFNREPPLSMTDPGWAEWTALTLGRMAAEGRQGGAPNPSTDGPCDGPVIHDTDGASEEARGRLVRWIAGMAMAMLVLTNIAAIGWAWISQAAGASSRQSAAQDCSGRLLTEECAARYVGMDVAVFRQTYDRLSAAGFPAPEALTGGFDRLAIDRWIDGRAGRPEPTPLPAIGSGPG